MRSRLTPDNARFAARMRDLRLASGVSQKQVAVVLDVSTQQVSKYERALNRVAACRLPALAMLFGVSVAAFFKDSQ